MSSWVLSMKVFLISAGFVALGMGIKLSVPIAVNEIPAMWSIIMAWLKPPYLYIIINGIIITIAASSRFHYSSQSEPSVRPEHDLISVKTPPPSGYASVIAQLEMSTVLEESTAEIVVSESEDKALELKPVLVNGSNFDESTVEIETETEAEDVFDESIFTYSNNTLPQEIISPELQSENLVTVREKPLVLSRFAHRKPIRTNPEVPGKRAALRVAKPKRHETLESTWKMITEGRHVPLTRHLKKSDTFEPRHVTPAADHVPKSGTFKERSKYESPKIRKEPSPGQDELNRRVEAFIKKINDDMRMQRQESIKKYMEMINRGV